MEAKVYNQEGKKKGSIELPEVVFGLPWNGDLVHQVMMGMISNKRAPVAHTKGRGDVSGGGRKPWKQKGTGKARHGSRRSPIWKGGGITFGPTNEKNFEKKINKKMKVKALYTLLSEKLRSNEILFIDALPFAETKSSVAKKVLRNLSTISGFEGMDSKKKNSAGIYLTKKDNEVSRSFSNFGNVAIFDMKNMNPLDISKYKYVVVTDPKESIKFLESKLKTSQKSIKSRVNE